MENSYCGNKRFVLYSGLRMKLSGFLLLLAGWGIVLSALALLTAEGPRAAFVLAGIGVEILGLFLFARSHLVPQKERE
jgi:hypothetical protein